MSATRQFLRRHALTTTILLLSMAGVAHAAEMTLTLDPSATEVSFALGATGHDVHGVLTLRAGQIHFDPETGQASGTIEIDALSGDTGSKKRDKTMHKKVLLSKEHPLIVFTAERFEGELKADGPSEVALHGMVSLAGHVHPLKLPATVSVEGDRAKADVAFDVPYVEWGLHNPSMMILRVAKDVQVSIATAGTLVSTTTEPAPASR